MTQRLTILATPPQALKHTETNCRTHNNLNIYIDSSYLCQSVAWTPDRIANESTATGTSLPQPLRIIRAISTGLKYCLGSSMAKGKNFKDKLSLIEFRIMRPIMSAHFYFRRKFCYDQSLLRIRA
jgi:hypothetical protein